MVRDLQIVRPAEKDLPSAYRVFEASITDAFLKDGLGHLKEDLLNEIEYKKSLLTDSVENADSDMLFMLAKTGDLVIGTISYGPCGDDIKICTNHQLDAVGEVGSIYVLPEYYGQGVASALIGAMAAYLYQSGVEQFCLDSGYKHAQKRWLRKFGEPYKIAKDYWGEGSDHMIWLCKVIDYVKGCD